MTQILVDIGEAISDNLILNSKQYSKINVQSHYVVVVYLEDLSLHKCYLN